VVTNGLKRTEGENDILFLKNAAENARGILSLIQVSFSSLKSSLCLLKCRECCRIYRMVKWMKISLALLWTRVHWSSSSSASATNIWTTTTSYLTLSSGGQAKFPSQYVCTLPMCKPLIFVRLLVEIRTFVEKRTKRNFLKRHWKHTADDQKVDQYREKLKNWMVKLEVRQELTSRRTIYDDEL